jgi:hypothetical protein
MIGIRKQSFVADMSTLAQTWNYPVWAYSFKYLRDSYGNPLRMTSQQKQDYRIKPAMETIAVKTTFYYMDPAIAGYRQAQKYNSNRSGSTFKELYYFLEYDPFTRKITGGTWFNGKALPQLDFSHIENVPDFLWTTEPLSLEGKSEIFKAIFKPLAP